MGWIVVGEGRRNILFKSENSLHHGYLLRIPKVAFCDSLSPQDCHALCSFSPSLLFAPILYRRFISLILFANAEDVDFFTPKALPFVLDQRSIEFGQLPAFHSWSVYWIPNSIIAGCTTIEFKPKCPEPERYQINGFVLCSTCLTRLVKQNQCSRCPLEYFSTREKDSLAHLLRSDTSNRVKVHHIHHETDYELVALALIKSQILERIKEAIDLLYAIFSSCSYWRDEVEYEVNQLRNAYLRIFRRFFDISRDATFPKGTTTKLGRSMDDGTIGNLDAVAAYMVFRTLRDCSLIINIKPKQEREEGLIQWRELDQRHLYSIQAIDFDEKLWSNLPKYLSQLECSHYLHPSYSCFDQ